MKSAFSTTVDFQADRARLFARAPAKIFFGHIASACVLIYLAWDVLALHWILLWAAHEILLTPTLLYVLGKQAENAEETNLNHNLWQNRLHALFALVGLSWGTFTFFGLDVQNPAHFSMQMAIVAGASAAAARSLGIFKFSFFFYEIPFTGLLAIRIFFMGGDFILLGVLVVIFMIMMCGLANDTSEELSDYLATKLENLDLAEKYRAAATDADRANSAKTQFLAQANHDLRQPIHAIALLSECLRDQPLDKEGTEILNTIDTSVDNLSKLFKSLLNITSLDAGGLHPEMSSFSLDEVLRQTVRQAQPEADERGCELRIVPTSYWVKTDKALLTSILQNLVFNAVKYAPNAKILVGARVSGNKIAVHVLDQGSGVPDHLTSKIFEEFVRGNPHGPGRTDGLGLGLSIVARTAKLLNLDVKFSSKENIGTHVCIMGLTRAYDKHQLASAIPNADPLPSIGARILIVDDNPEVLFGMAALLKKWGYVVSACSPDQEIKTVPDVILMDFHLNGPINGIQLAKDIAQKHSTPIPTAIISGTINDEIEQSAKDAGFLTLHKPVSALQLRSMLLAMTTKSAETVTRTDDFT
ncbi:ATP-binding response regulator [Maritalea sp.]|uniref:ATP-binding response regulator n=1 Tax=Maritalea sp. TaxID=2003361 RepID=UPI003EF43744